MKMEVTFALLPKACFNVSQPSVPPVTLFYLGARRTGILATVADIPTLFVLPLNACACIYVYGAGMRVHAWRQCARVGRWGLCMQEHRQNIGVRMHGDARLLPVMALKLLASERRKLFTLCPYTVSDGHNNAARQGLVGRFLCIASIDGVCALHS